MKKFILPNLLFTADFRNTFYFPVLAGTAPIRRSKRRSNLLILVSRQYDSLCIHKRTDMHLSASFPMLYNHIQGM